MFNSQNKNNCIKPLLVPDIFISMGLTYKCIQGGFSETRLFPITCILVVTVIHQSNFMKLIDSDKERAHFDNHRF